MGIWLLEPQLFVSATTPPPPKGSALVKAISRAVTNPRGAKILVIDEALQGWDAVKKAGSDPQKIKALNRVSAACAWWLAQKSLKTSALTQSRAVHIRRVRDAALAEISRLGAAEFTMAARKAQAIESGQVQGTRGAGFRSPTAKSLHGGYANERLAYETLGKGGTSIAAGFVHYVAKAEGADFDTLSVDAYKAYFDQAIAGASKRQKTATELASSVEYLSRSERAQFLVVSHGNTFDRADGMPADTLIVSDKRKARPQMELEMYAMDRYGNLFVRRYPGSSVGKPGYFNHSSFAAGNEVICAGMIGFSKGTLVHIDNASGHYQPDYRRLHACLLTLQQQGVNVDNVRVMSFFGDSATSPPPLFHDGANFLMNPNRPVSTWDSRRDTALNLP